MNPNLPKIKEQVQLGTYAVPSADKIAEAMLSRADRLTKNSSAARRGDSHPAMRSAGFRNPRDLFYTFIPHRT